MNGKKLNDILANIHLNNDELRTELTFEKLSHFFHLPAEEAAKQLHVCTSVLKRACRKNGIQRWPYRKVKSIDNLICSTTDSEKIAKLQLKREFLIKNPNTAVQDITSSPSVSKKPVGPQKTIEKKSPKRVVKNSRSPPRVLPQIANLVDNVNINDNATNEENEVALFKFFLENVALYVAKSQYNQTLAPYEKNNQTQSDNMRGFTTAY